jgi:hypothetical protein
MLSEAAFQQGDSFALMIQVPKTQVGPGSPPVHRHDQGFMSIGLRPVFSDKINGGTDPYGNPLSFSREWQNFLLSGQDASKVVDLDLAQSSAGLLTPPVANPGGPPATDFTQPIALGVDGASKSPILRNVALTPPYFSWGGYPNLRQAMKLYNRGGNRREITAANAAVENTAGVACTSGDNSGTGPDGGGAYPLTGVTACDTNTTGPILSLGLLDCDPDVATGVPPAACATAGRDTSNDDLAALVRFMKALTDTRVQCDKAPFDHPELMILNGHTATDPNHDGKATDNTFKLPAAGAAGYAPSSGFCIPNAGDLFAPGMQARSGGAKVVLY